VEEGVEEEGPGVALLSFLRRTSPEPTVRAAGGALWRHRAGGDLEVLLVHRPRYDDWSLPKGKCEKGETDEDCARREVAEETGLRCGLGPELPSQRYRDQKGRDKLVRYWAMKAPAEEGVLEHEVDEVAWLPLNEARRRLSYERDAEVLDALPAALARAKEHR
jgi:8-oxo-dGTP pyrophosphatase MutT (NUDIX family)